FQAEDGIRDATVTGVQTCALPIFQTIRPSKWVIVSDGSTDRTDEIVERYVAAHPWIELVRMPERKERHFAGKVHAFNAGRARVRSEERRVGKEGRRVVGGGVGEQR